jgi:hypothetical protein
MISKPLFRGKRSGLLVLGAAIVASSLAVQAPAHSEPTPITDQSGVTGTSPNGGVWLETINEKYGLTASTPVTDQYDVTKQPDIKVWLEALNDKYTIAQYPTPVTEQYGATASSADAGAWRENIKEKYVIR